MQGKYRLVAGDPTASVNTMINGASTPTLTAVAGVLKDPSGDANYSAGVAYSAQQSIEPTVLGSVIVGCEASGITG